MESYPSSQELVLQMDDGQRKAMFAKMHGMLDKTSGRARFASIGKSIGNLRTTPTAAHHIDQARQHMEAAKDAASKGNSHLSKLHQSLSAKHALLARHVQSVRSPEWHREQAKHESAQADRHTMMGEHTMSRKSVATARGHEKIANLKEQGMREANVSSDRLRYAAGSHRMAAFDPTLKDEGLKQQHADAAIHLDNAAKARDAARAKKAEIKQNLISAEHRNVAMDHYRAGREASLKNDHATAQQHYATADLHMATARVRDANTLGKKNVVGRVTDTANEHLRTIGASAADRVSKINKPQRPTMKRNKGVKPVEPVRPVKPVEPVRPVEPVKGIRPVPPVQPK